jgi:hypothetical protein
MSNYESFGISSLLLYFPYIHAQFNLKGNNMWKISLSIIPFSSYLWNKYLTDIYRFADYSAIIYTVLNYLYARKMYYWIYIILSLYSIELYNPITKLLYSRILSYLLIYYYALRTVDHKHLILGIINLIISTICFIKRNPQLPSYHTYTIIWHICCASSLYIGNVSLISINKNKLILL